MGIKMEALFAPFNQPLLHKERHFNPPVAAILEYWLLSVPQVTFTW
jgi:hypothetical protein